MTYKIEIDETNPKALNIINLLSMLAIDYDFMQITKFEDGLEFLSEAERSDFEHRYSYALEHTDEGKTWEEIEYKLTM